MLLNESVRAASACVAYDRDCRHTPFSNEAAPARLPLMQMRSVDSTTAISLGVLWSGIAPESGREALHSAPLVWEYAAAGVERSSANSLSTEKGAHSSEISPVGEASGELWSATSRKITGDGKVGSAASTLVIAEGDGGIRAQG
jgi:hypothetical protein